MRAVAREAEVSTTLGHIELAWLPDVAGMGISSERSWTEVQVTTVGLDLSVDIFRLKN